MKTGNAIEIQGLTKAFGNTHAVDDLSFAVVCERVAILHHGRLIANGDLADLKRRHGAQQMDGKQTLGCSSRGVPAFRS